MLTEGVPEEDWLCVLLQLAEAVLQPLLLRESEPEEEAEVLPLLLALPVALLQAEAEAH